MAVDIRQVRDDELERAHFLIAYAFAGDRSEEGRQQMQHIEEMGPIYGLYEDGEMVACLRIYPLAMLVNGASVPMGGVSAVACLPEHRRKGYIGQLLRHCLSLMREQGQPISALYTPHPDLYRRYGWMFAASALRYIFEPKQIVPLNRARPAGRARRLTEEEWPALAEVFRRFTAGRNGYLDRSERWWKEYVFRRLYDVKRRLNDVAVWTDDAGEARGYLVYRCDSERRGGDHVDMMEVREFIALDANAYLGLLRYLLSHDLVDEVSWIAPVQEPLPQVVEEPWRIKREYNDIFGFMLRVVDIEKAVAARPPGPGAPEGAFTLRIADAAAPWNQGAWRIECAGGRLSATKTDGATSDLATDAAAFAAMYNGFLRPGEAVRCGLAEAEEAAALALAERLLATAYPPVPCGFF